MSAAVNIILIYQSAPLLSLCLFLLESTIQSGLRFSMLGEEFVILQQGPAPNRSSSYFFFRSAISNNGPDTSASPKQEELSSAAALLDVLGIPTVADEHHEVVIENYPEVCPDCDMGFGNITDLLVHANEMHEFKGVIKQEIFSSYSAFEVSFSALFRSFSGYKLRVFQRWKEEMEKEHCTHWIRRGERAVHMVFYAHLRCRWFVF